MNVNDNGSIAADVELLSSEPEIVDDVKDVKDDIKIPEPEEDEILDDSEDENEEESEEDSEEDEPKSESNHSRPTLTDIKKEYPEFFKKFPGLRDTIFREQEYSTLYPTVDSAKEAYENNQTFENLRNDLFDGEGKSFINALKESEGLEKFSVRFLNNLATADKDVHWKVVAPVLQNVLRAAFSRGTRSGNDNLANSSAWIADYLFGNGGLGDRVDPDISQYLDGKKLIVPEPEKIQEKKIDPEANQYRIQRFTDFSNDVNGEVETKLTSEISKGLEGRGLSKLELKTLINDIRDEVVRGIADDKRHMSSIDSMWKTAIRNGFKTQDKSSLISASLARASSLIPSVRRRLLTEALKDSSNENLKNADVLDKVKSRREVGNLGKPSRNSSGQVTSAKNVNWSKTSDMDFLSGRIATK